MVKLAERVASGSLDLESLKATDRPTDEVREELLAIKGVGAYAAANGAFSAYQKPVPSGAYHCLNGNLLFALQRLGFGDDPRAEQVRDWLVPSMVGEQPIRYYDSAVCAPGFACGVNEKQPCAWGANKAIRALLETPGGARTPLVERALEVGAEFLLSRDPAVADYPYTERVSST